jgi:NAD(P)-dependent dehydrogenase (short-subunit alcohol dehydrogenase family)
MTRYTPSSRTLGLVAAGAVAAALWRLATTSSYSFAGKVVVITGGSRGLGLELARLAAEEGASVALLARDQDELDRARTDLEAITDRVHVVRCDVADLPGVAEALQGVVARFGRLDVLINNAGVIQVGPVEHMALDDYESAMAVHFRGPLHTMLWAIPYFRRQGGGRIVNIASVGGKIPVPHLAPYVASKFALVGLSSSLRAELAKDGIVITTVSPGLMRTGSPINVSVKGQHEREWAWFVIADSLPGLSMASRRAARQILEASRSGRAEIILSLPARLAAALYGLAPDTFVRLASSVNLLLPGAVGGSGDEAKLGRDSTSAWAPSALTTLTDRAAERNNELPRPTLAAGPPELRPA